MAEQEIQALVEGGKASAGPPLGPQLGPMGVNIGEVIAKINEKTKDFAGMQIPVKVKVDPDTKEFDIEVGSPPAAGLIKAEAGIEKGSGNPKDDKVADILIEQVIKIAKMKEASLMGKTLQERVKEIIGTCHSMGVLVEKKAGAETIKDVNEGKFDKEITEEKTELSAEEKKKLEEEKKKLQAEIEQRRAEFEKAAKEIISGMQGKERNIIKKKLDDAGIPAQIIEELLPAEGAAAPGEEKPAEKKE